jgi:hypothetical protein
MIDLPRRHASRYVQPLREGGSLPAIVDTDDGPYVVKFRGAGQGVKALVAELIVGHLARSLEFPVPDLALVEIAPLFGRSEPDPEIQELLRASHGINVGMRYLDGAFNFDAHAAGELIDPSFGADVVWLDAFLTNPDRTPRNSNLLIWQRRPWLIDHGAALYAHHDWSGVDEARARTPFPLIQNHVLLTRGGAPEAADERLAPRITESLLRDVLESVPDDLLIDQHARESFGNPEEARERYVGYLLTRMREPREFVQEAARAREAKLREAPHRLRARR